MRSQNRLRCGGFLRLATMGLSILGVMTAVQAQASTTRTATFLVSLTLTSDCQISTNPLNFGSSGVLQAAINQTATLNVTCSSSTPYNIGLDAGSVTGSTVAARLLANGSTTVQFQMYQDTARSIVWGNTIGTNTLTGTGTGAVQALTVYGQVPTQTTPAAATYTSTVTMSVTF